MRGFSSLAIVLALGSVASAAAITQTQNFNGTPNFNSVLTFQEFDDQSGSLTLQSIEVIFSVTVTGGQLVLDNDGDDPASGTFEFGAKGSISSTDVSLVDGSSQPVTDELESIHSQAFSLDGNVGDGSGDYDPSSPDGMSYDGGTENDSDSGFVGSHVFGQYTGTSTYDITASLSQWQDFGGISGIEWAVSPVSASGSVRVIYNYIPEPASLGLLCLGGLALIRRRRR